MTRPAARPAAGVWTHMVGRGQRWQRSDAQAKERPADGKLWPQIAGSEKRLDLDPG